MTLNPYRIKSAGALYEVDSLFLCLYWFPPIQTPVRYWDGWLFNKEINHREGKVKSFLAKLGKEKSPCVFTQNSIPQPPNLELVAFTHTQQKFIHVQPFLLPGAPSSASLEKKKKSPGWESWLKGRKSRKSRGRRDGGQAKNNHQV